MEDFIQNEKRSDRRRKQEFLVKQILEPGYADAFSEFLGAEKPNGEDINSWTFEELETLVVYFKRSIMASSDELSLHFKLEEFDTGESDTNTFAKKIPTPTKKASILSGNDHMPEVEKAEAFDNGYFSKPTVAYTIVVPGLRLQCQRLEADFRWLQESLGREFPFVPLPPLIPRTKEVISPALLKNTAASRRRYLRDLAEHPRLRGSLSLETFLTSSRDEFQARARELAKYFEKNLPVERGLTKKAFDGSTRDFLGQTPTEKGFVDVKLSPHLQAYFNATEGQFPRYEAILDRIEKAATEWDTDAKRLASSGEKLRTALSELQAAALKFNAQRPGRSVANVLEEAVHGALTSVLESETRALEESRRLFKNHVGHHFRHLRGYVESLNAALAQRSHFALEAAKARGLLNDRKAKRLESDGGNGEIDSVARAVVGLSAEAVRASPEIAKKLLFPEDSMRLRRFSELAAFVNLSVYKEVLYFEDYLVARSLENLQGLCKARLELSKRSREVWEEVDEQVRDMQAIGTHYRSTDKPRDLLDM